MSPRPRLPVGQHRRIELPGTRMPRKRVLQRLERPGDLGLVVCTTRVGQAGLPGHQRQAQRVHPVVPSRGQGQVCPIALDRLPPNVAQGRETCQGRGDVRSRLFLRREPVRGEQGCEGPPCGLEPVGHLGCGLAGHVLQTPGRPRQREGGTGVREA